MVVQHAEDGLQHAEVEAMFLHKLLQLLDALLLLQGERRSHDQSHGQPLDQPQASFA